jgi:hypothetical protein
VHNEYAKEIPTRVFLRERKRERGGELNKNTLNQQLLEII